MSEQRMLQIISDESHPSSAFEAATATVRSKYGPGFADTFYMLLRRGYVDKRPSGRVTLTKEGRALLARGR
jgi:hypothetical protein